MLSAALTDNSHLVLNPHSLPDVLYQSCRHAITKSFPETIAADIPFHAVICGQQQYAYMTGREMSGLTSSNVANKSNCQPVLHAVFLSVPCSLQWGSYEMTTFAFSHETSMLESAAFGIHVHLLCKQSTTIHSVV